MNAQQKADFANLTTVAERAKFLLDIGVTARTNIVDLTPVEQACVGDVMLPITADNEADAVKKGVDWLKSKMGHNASREER